MRIFMVFLSFVPKTNRCDDRENIDRVKCPLWVWMQRPIVFNLNLESCLKLFLVVSIHWRQNRYFKSGYGDFSTVKTEISSWSLARRTKRFPMINFLIHRLAFLSLHWIIYSSLTLNFEDQSLAVIMKSQHSLESRSVINSVDCRDSQLASILNIV